MYCCIKVTTVSGVSKPFILGPMKLAGYFLGSFESAFLAPAMNRHFSFVCAASMQSQISSWPVLHSENVVCTHCIAHVSVNGSFYILGKLFVNCALLPSFLLILYAVIRCLLPVHGDCLISCRAIAHLRQNMKPSRR